MTLLLNLIGPSGIHQSSDFRLTEMVNGQLTGRSIEDSFGSKQLPFSFTSWSANFSFTGVVEINGRKTRDWILETLNGAPQSTAVATAMASIATRATKEFCRVSPKDWDLTIVVTVSEIGKAIQLLVISCYGKPGGPAANQRQGRFNVYEFSSQQPRLLILGFSKAVDRSDRKLLKDLSHKKRDPALIRAALAEINLRASNRSPWISAGCLVISTLPDGQRASENFGGTPGVPPHMVGSQAIADQLARTFAGKKPAFVQSREGRATGESSFSLGPMANKEGDTLVAAVRGDGRIPVFVTDSAGNIFTAMFPNFTQSSKEEEEEVEFEKSQGAKYLSGEPRIVTLSAPAVSQRLTNKSGSVIALLNLYSLNGQVSLEKRRLKVARLHTLTVSLCPDVPFSGSDAPLQSGLKVASLLKVGGAELQKWFYEIDVIDDGISLSFSIRRNSVSIRSANFKTELQFLTGSEEVLVAAPRTPFILKVTPEKPTTSGDIEARFFLQDLRETTPRST